MIYADHAATTRLSPKALEAMRPWLEEEYANPSTLYSFSRNARRAVSEAREKIASAIGANADEIYFTSGGTEADNWALKSIAFRQPNQRGRIITSAVEHHAILNTCAFLERIGFEVTYLPVDRHGIVSCKDLADALIKGTVLVSVMTANNELGTIEPIAELAEAARQHNVLFHTDAVQAVGHIPVNVEKLGVDLLSASAHKFNGPKGIGFLYIRKGTAIEAFIHGGGQEKGMRSGTENIAGIVGMAAALEEHLETMIEDAVQCERLRAKLIDLLRKAGLDFVINSGESHIPGSLSISFRGAKGEMLLHRLDLMGIAIAVGSACNAKETKLSHVIQAIQIPEEYRNGTVRITLGADNDDRQIEEIASGLNRIFAR